MIKMTKETKNISQEQTKKLLLEMTELAKRTQANFENYRKQTEKRIEDYRNFATKDIIVQILPIVDNFDLAIKNTDINNEFINGIKLIHEQFNNFLEDNHVELIETKNQMFDPNFHEALVKVDSDLPENTIVEEFQKGYTLHGLVIRHAKVKISAGIIKEEEKKQNNNLTGENKNDR